MPEFDTYTLCVKKWLWIGVLEAVQLKSERFIAPANAAVPKLHGEVRPRGWRQGQADRWLN